MKSNNPLDRLHQRLSEAYDELWDNFVDPREPFLDDAERWLPLAGGGVNGATSASPASEAELAEIRRQCRVLAARKRVRHQRPRKPHQLHRRRGHTYRAAPRKGQVPRPRSSPPSKPTSTSSSSQQLAPRQQEIVRRRDRDGEAFLRFFPAPDGSTRVRFVEPDQVSAPPEQAGNPAARSAFSPLATMWKPCWAISSMASSIDAAESSIARPTSMPTCTAACRCSYPVRKNLRRAEKLLRNMSVVAEIQSAIALIRKPSPSHRHRRAAIRRQPGRLPTGGTPGVNDGRGDELRSAATAPARFSTPTPASITTSPPRDSTPATSWPCCKPSCAPIASRLVMPEFMLTSDASNANYASTMVAEGPAMRMFAGCKPSKLATIWK